MYISMLNNNILALQSIVSNEISKKKIEFKMDRKVLLNLILVLYSL